MQTMDPSTEPGETTAEARLQQALDEARANTQAVIRVVEAIGKAPTLSAAVQVTLDTVRSAFGWDYASFWQLDPAEHALRFSAQSGSVSPEFQQVTAEARFREGEGLSGRTWRAKDLVFVEDLAQVHDCSRAPAARRAGVKSGICFPIMVAGEFVGTMDFFALRSLTLADERREVLRSVGQLVSAGMERLRNAERQAEVVRGVESNTSALSTMAGDLGRLSSGLTTVSEGNSRQAETVARNCEEMSRNVQTVAAAAEEMTITIQEIARNVQDSSRLTSESVALAQNANETITQLGHSSREIGQVVKLITTIAQQTNLLALNATIEAARAGEAGRGFAVVASEVKELAKETARATEDISAKIEATQRDTQRAVEAISRIGTAIGQINEITTTISSAIEEQSVTTQEITRNMNEAATGTSAVVRNISEVAEGLAETQSQATSVLDASQSLTALASDLESTIRRFA